MLLWIIFAALTAGAVLVLSRPLRRDSVRPLRAEGADAAVYRDQLEEIKRDADRQIIGADDAEAARTEIARRLLRSVPESDDADSHGDHQPVSPRKIGYAIAASVALFSIGLYASLGSPWLPDRPYAGRQTANLEEASVLELVARVEERLRRHPDDGRGWDAVAPIYLRLQRYADAAAAYRNSLRLLGETPARLAGLARASLVINNGIVSEDIRKASARLLELDPQRAEAKFWLALAKEQDGDREGAASDYRSILQSAPDDAPWRAMVERRLESITSATRR